MLVAHFPARAPIDAYGNGGFRFADMSHRGSILCLPSGTHGWDVGEPAGLSLVSFAEVLAQASEIEVLLCGMGSQIALLSQELRLIFRANAIAADVMSTGAAVRTFNVMLAEGRAVAAALIAVP